MSNKYIWCAVGMCKKHRRLDNRPRQHYARVNSKEVLEKLRKLNEEVMMGDFVCVDCRKQANDFHLKQLSECRDDEQNRELSVEEEDDGDLIEIPIPIQDENDAFDLDEINQLNSEEVDDNIILSEKL